MTNYYQGHRLIFPSQSICFVDTDVRRLQDDEDLFAIDLFEEEIY